jgi:hypothetical protein
MDRALNVTLVEVVVEAIRSSMARTCPAPSISLSNWEWWARLAAFFHHAELSSRFRMGPELLEHVVNELLSRVGECSKVSRKMSPGHLRRMVKGQVILVNALERMSVLPDTWLHTRGLDTKVICVGIFLAMFTGLSCMFATVCAFVDLFCWSVCGFSLIEEGLCIAYEEDVFSLKGSFLRASLAAVELGLGFSDPNCIARGVLLYGVVAALEMVCRYPNRKLFLTCGSRLGLQMVYWFSPWFTGYSPWFDCEGGLAQTSPRFWCGLRC